ncbi:protein translocase subunit secY/sec61 alpha [Natranaerovirga hydrolytica]|uniref:Protein translocase subunit SecY n=1 Tax=Natranaerovirga hydrolytica TaxID=680378 RepID=A0A4R1MQ12_9FIRM|nr:preprotein translocase subunit SecY [Natranaerovirga hydrolytica]TCK93434.1 protein translocase subunit secY/sec61 alpha [Natranaerovirga hydrolytica]
MLKTLRNAFKIPDLRRKLLYTFMMLIIIRLGAVIPVPGVDASIISSWFDTQNEMFSLFDAMTGGSFAEMSLFAMGIIPYITASIIMNLLTIAIPKLEQIQKEDEDGRKKIAKYTRYLTIVLAVIQSTATAIGFGRQGLITNYNIWNVLVFILATTAGTALLMWIGERITENGIGNGISLIIFINILSRLPIDLRILFNQITAESRAFVVTALILLICLIIFIAIVTFVVLLQVGERRIPVQYAKRMQGRTPVGGNSTHIPLKVNTAGVIPVIFASSLLQFPAIITQFFTQQEVTGIWGTILNFINYTTWSGAILYAALIIFFAYFYTSITFNPMEVANNMKKNGGFIPGIRPGKPTVEHLTRIVNNIVLVGALGLTLIAIIPIILQGAYGLSLSFLGTSLIIVVGVALETVKQIEAQMLMRHYKGFLKS